MPENGEIERCGYLCVHEETVEQVLSQMPDDETLYDLAELCKIFGDSTRIKILYALFEA
ncbi:MAG: transcriptional regulator, partial [Oscillospiraceae bacterium]|nr:transcriptional regulator [Oscillospiraceae bacterium]